jgi:hypothetical protein
MALTRLKNYITNINIATTTVVKNCHVCNSLPHTARNINNNRNYEKQMNINTPFS